MDKQRKLKWHTVELIGIVVTALIAPALVVGCIVVDDLTHPAVTAPIARAAITTADGVTKRPEACSTPPGVLSPGGFFLS